jgi:hypothetical protein
MKYGKFIIYIIYITISINILTANGTREDSSRLVSENCSKYSPSGKYKLSSFIGTDNNLQYYYFTVSYNNNVVYTSTEKYYRRFTFFLCWDDKEDIIWCYSGDIGAYYWINENDSWNQYTYFSNNGDTNIEPPAILRKIRPQFFR